MDFYNVLSKYYDVIFTKDSNTINFLKEGLNSSSKVLDVACGTGSYSLALAENNITIEGIDLDKEMIQQAENKNKTTRANFLEGNMLELNKYYDKESFDRIYCIGNSLVHLNNEEEVKKSLSEMYSLLNAGGDLIIQIINYDRILEKNIKALPTIVREEEELEFQREYELNSRKKIVFTGRINLFKEGKKESYENSVELLPLKWEQLNKILTDIGYKSIEAYGSFKKDAYNLDAYALIVKAYK